MAKLVTLEDVRSLALALPETTERTAYGNAAWAVKGKMFVWERPLRKADLAALGASAPRGTIVGVWTADLEMKAAMIASDPKVFFTTPHFDGYAALLIALEKITRAALKRALVDAWLARAPKRVATEFLASGRS
jgi:hypothetical protein